MQLFKNMNLKGTPKNGTSIKREEKVYTLTQTELDNMKNELTRKAVDKAFTMMLAIPVMVLHDHHWSKCRTNIPKFVDKCLDLYDSYDKGYVSFDDMVTTLEEESGIKIVKEK